MPARLEFKDITEASRVRRIVEMWNPSNEDLIPWRDDLVARLGVQIYKMERGGGTCASSAENTSSAAF